MTCVSTDPLPGASGLWLRTWASTYGVCWRAVEIRIRRPSAQEEEWESETSSLLFDGKVAIIRAGWGLFRGLEVYDCLFNQASRSKLPELKSRFAEK